MIPATVSTAPATRSLAPRRVRTNWARRIIPMTANSAPVRIRLRVRLVRACRANLGAPYSPTGPPDEPHTTRFCRCDRSLMHLPALCVPHGTPVRFHRPGLRAIHDIEHGIIRRVGKASADASADRVLNQRCSGNREDTRFRYRPALEVGPALGTG
jgi:hypothetical protein